MDRRDIVVIGASAGGLDALRALIGPLDELFPAAFFLVSHVAPGRSRLDEVLAAGTSLRVLFAQDGATAPFCGGVRGKTSGARRSMCCSVRRLSPFAAA